MLSSILKIAGIDGHKTNHSLMLQAAVATDMFRAGVPEKIIQQHIGHLSLKALGVYERTTVEQHQAVSNILQSNVPSPSYSKMIHSAINTDSTQHVSLPNIHIIVHSNG